MQQVYSSTRLNKFNERHKKYRDSNSNYSTKSSRSVLSNLSRSSINILTAQSANSVIGKIAPSQDSNRVSGSNRNVPQQELKSDIFRQLEKSNMNPNKLNSQEAQNKIQGFEVNDEESYNNSDSDDELDEIESEALQHRISKEFQEQVIKYVRLDDIIKKRESEIRELKAQKKPSEAFIIKYLDQIDESIIEITGGKIKKKTAQSRANISKEIIKNVLSVKIANLQEVDNIINTMETLRPIKERTSLKRTMEK